MSIPASAIVNVVPSVMLDPAFSLDGSFSPGGGGGGVGLFLDFTTGTYVGATPPANTNSTGGYAETLTGALTLFAPNILRRTNKGLLVEPTATNLCRQSASLPTTPWILRSLSMSAGVTGPDGSTALSAMTLGTGGGSDFYQSAMTGTTAGVHAVSFWIVKTATTGTLRILNAVAGAAEGQWDIDLSVLPAGLQRVTATTPGVTVVAPFTTGATAIGVQFFMVSGTAVLDIGFVQVEKAAVPSSYIATTTVAVARAADSVAFIIPGGITALTYTFDDDSTQNVSVSPGAYVIPTNLNRRYIKRLVGS